MIRLKQPKAKPINNSTTQLVSIYPNPASNLINISNSDIGTVVITDITGKQIKKIIGNNIKTVDISTLHNGFYIIKAINNNNNKSLVSKLIIHH